MKKLFNDKKSLTIVILAILLIIFASLYFLQQNGTLSPTVVTVGTTTINEREIIDELKSEYGFSTISNLINSYVLAEYAKTIGIVVTNEDISELMKINEHRADTLGMTLTDLIKESGSTASQWDREARRFALELKLVYNDEEMIKAINDGMISQPPYSMPEVIKVRLYTFSDATSANAATELLNSNGRSAFASIAEMLLDRTLAENVSVYSTSDETESLRPILAVAKEMDNESFSPVVQLGKNSYLIVELIEKKPAFQANASNGMLMAANALMEANMKEHKSRLEKIKSLAFSKVNVDFISMDYPELKEAFRQKKLENPNLPGMEN